MMAGVPSVILLYQVLGTEMSLGSSAQEVTQIHEQKVTVSCTIYKAGRVVGGLGKKKAGIYQGLGDYRA